MGDRTPPGFAVLALGALLGLAACDRSSQSTMRAGSTPTPAIPKILRPLPQVSDLDKRVSFTKNGVESSMGTGTLKDFGDIGLPIYPTLKPADTYVVEHADAKSSGMTIQGPVQERATVVDAWYASRLGSSFRAGRVRLFGGEVGTFSRKTARENESVLVQAQRDGVTGREMTTLTLTVTKRR